MKKVIGILIIVLSSTFTSLSQWTAGFNLNSNYGVTRAVTPENLQDLKLFARDGSEVSLPEDVLASKLSFPVDLYFRKIGKNALGSFSIGLTHYFFIGIDNNEINRSSSHVFSEYRGPAGKFSQNIFSIYVEPVMWSFFFEKDIWHCRRCTRLQSLSLILKWNKQHTVWEAQIPRAVEKRDDPYRYKKLAKVSGDNLGVGLMYRYHSKRSPIFLGISAEYHLGNTVFREKMEFKVLVGVHVPRMLMDRKYWQ